MSKLGDLAKAGRQTAKNIVSKTKYNWWTNMRAGDLSTHEIGPEGIVGAKNWKIHKDTLRGLLRKGDPKGMKKYIAEQSKKVHASS